MTVLRDIVSQANVYVTSRGKGRVNIEVVERVARWVGDMLKMFGLGEGQSKEIGWGDVREDGAEGNVSVILFTQD
jgi:cysteinyl-tRNA synthetase